MAKEKQTIKIELHISEPTTTGNKYKRKLFWVSVGSGKELSDFTNQLDNFIIKSDLWK